MGQPVSADVYHDNGLARDVADLKARLDALAEEVRKEHAARLEQHEDRISELEALAGRTAKELRGVRGEIGTLVSNVHRLAGELMVLPRIEQTQRRVVDLLEQLVSEKRITNALETTLAEIEGSRD
jgi:chromosome segregation ATPase